MTRPAEEAPPCAWGREFFTSRDSARCSNPGEFVYQIPGAAARRSDGARIVEYVCADHLAELQKPPPPPEQQPSWWGEEHTIRVLQAFDRCDAHSELFWRTDAGYAPVTFMAMCSDTFALATADAEPITVNNLPVLEEAIKDVVAVISEPSFWAITLFVARVRQQRPLRGAYPSRDLAALWPLFDACGPDPDADAEPVETNPAKDNGRV